MGNLNDFAHLLLEIAQGEKCIMLQSMKRYAPIAQYKRIYKYEGVDYLGLITVKKMRSKLRMAYYDKKKELHVSILPSVSYEELDAFVIENLPKLVKRAHKRIEPKSRSAGFYILGEERPLEGNNAEESLLKHKKEAREFFLSRLRYYEKLMKIEKPYALTVRDTSSRFGSNSSKTHRIMLALTLYQFTTDCIDSVVVHELAHDAFRNHGKRFYDKVYKYCPNYPELRKRLLYNVFNPTLSKGNNEGKEERNDDEID